MRYCTKCGFEYQDWKKKCLDCGIRLTDRKPSAPAVKPRKKRGEKIVTIATFTYPEQAHLSRAKLESAGLYLAVVPVDRLCPAVPANAMGDSGLRTLQCSHVCLTSGTDYL